jgi:hypothetical protein
MASWWRWRNVEVGGAEEEEEEAGRRKEVVTRSA